MLSLVSKNFPSVYGCLVFVIAISSAAAAISLQRAPVNPAFDEWRSNKVAGANEFTLGYIPDPLNWSHLQLSQAKDILPARFDWRDADGLTAIRNQGSCGACWAFAACGSMEAWLKIQESEVRDFSENHIKNSHGFIPGPCAGGNNTMATAYLARWSGPLNESDDPYNPTVVTLPAAGAQVQKYLRFAPVYTSTSENRSQMQAAIMQQGPLSSSMYWNDLYFNAAANTYYYGGSNTVDHGVVVIGWDDAKLVPGAPNPGVWICRNSWGPAWGENGYFYVSYYDSKAVKEATGFFDLAPTSTYERVYQYDPLGMTVFAGDPPNDYSYAANVFTAVADETIIAVGTYAVANNTAYEITLYDSGIMGDIFVSPVTSISGVFENAGYHVVELPENVPVSSGQHFSVKVRYQTPGWFYPVPIEASVTGFASPTAAAGQSYLSESGVSFEDIIFAGDGFENANVCIKAFAGERTILPPTPTVRIVGRPRVEIGSHAVLKAETAHLVGSVSYEWLKDSVAIPGAIAVEYVITQVDESHAGVYVLRVTDESKGVYESAPFILEVLPEGSLPVSTMLVLMFVTVIFLLASTWQMRLPHHLK